MQHKPLKKFGQNFLQQPAIIEKIASSAQIDPTHTVIEIGPGPGTLTQAILDHQPQKVYAIEIDNRWAAELRVKFPDSVEIIEIDFLGWDMESLFVSSGTVKVLGNIPYNITSPILFKLVQHHAQLESAVLMMQKEVAKRIVAPSGSKTYGILSVLLQTFADIEYLFDVGRKNFFPIPKVDSAVIKMNFLKKVDGVDNIDLFRQIVRTTFNYRRKMLRNSLSRIFDQETVYSIDFIDLSKRPEQLTLEDFKLLSNTIHQITQK